MRRLGEMFPRQTISKVVSSGKIDRKGEFGDGFCISEGSYYSLGRNKYCKIQKIFKVAFGDKTEFVVEYNDFDIQSDHDTGIWYANLQETEKTTNCRYDLPKNIENRPSVYAIDDGKLWLLSETPNLNFPWMDAHLKE
ncbi:uncharacterized protein [Clytia hemisphaerica]|uniref:uncharacterized protein n=1 Tax=Clytia hemisphaerica TaxID=252671 RepID=UPI0034D74865